MTEMDESTKRPREQEAGPEGRCETGRCGPRRWLSNATVLLSGVTLALLLAEGATRLLYPVPLHATDTFLAIDNRDGRGQREAGTRLRRNTEARHQQDEFDVGVQINSKGLRDDEIAYRKPAGEKRFLSVGDSFAFGLGVELEETYCKVAEQALGGQWHGINTGVPGWSTADELDFLRYEGFRYQPDLVVVCHFRNDLTDNALHSAYHLTDGGRAERMRPFTGYYDGPPEALAVQPVLERIQQRRAQPGPPPREAPTGWWAAHSNLYRLARQAVSRARYRFGRQRDKQVDKLVAQRQQRVRDRHQTERPLTGALLAEITRECRSREVPTIILLMPHPEETVAHGQSGMREELRDITSPAESLGARVVDLAPSLYEAGVERVYFGRDYHINAVGHRIVGELLADAIEQMEAEGATGS